MKPEEFKAVREALGMTQAALAGELGVTASAISRWEAGERRIPEPVAKLVQRFRAERRPKKPKR